MGAIHIAVGHGNAPSIRVPLTNVAVQSERPRERSYKLADGQAYTSKMSSKLWTFQQTDRLKDSQSGQSTKRAGHGSVRPTRVLAKCEGPTRRYRVSYIMEFSINPE
ncbi:hypothetical protein PPGU19_010670 [Paraburkholderia sp. PGU19]|nr:hypothetical protein PPGU19_010670 [Paraburkholderia sp. PGU19]